MAPAEKGDEEQQGGIKEEASELLTDDWEGREEGRRERNGCGERESSKELTSELVLERKRQS